MPNVDESLVLTFQSVNYTMQAEKAFEDAGIELKIIPTPREISSSCGLSILTDMDNLEPSKELEENGMKVAAYWRYLDNPGGKEAILIED